MPGPKVEPVLLSDDEQRVLVAWSRRRKTALAVRSRVVVLRPGDVINTGTPAGVALGLPDHPYLRQGDVVELEIDGLGRQRQNFGQA
jgi:hypothetical protein